MTCVKITSPTTGTDKLDKSTQSNERTLQTAFRPAAIAGILSTPNSFGLTKLCVDSANDILDQLQNF